MRYKSFSPCLFLKKFNIPDLKLRVLRNNEVYPIKDIELAEKLYNFIINQNNDDYKNCVKQCSERLDNL